MEFRNLFCLDEQGKGMSIEDIERNANLFGKVYGESAKEDYLSKIFDGLHKA